MVFVFSHDSNKCILLTNLILRQFKKFGCYHDSPNFWIQKAQITCWFNKVAFHGAMKQLSAHFSRKFQNYFILLQWQDLTVTKLTGVCLGVNVYVAHWMFLHKHGSWPELSLQTFCCEENKRRMIFEREKKG